jgi:putative oxidoreductase
MSKLNELFTNFGLLWLRILAGAGIASHGYAKIFGGGIAGFTEGVAAMGFPAPEVFAWAAALSEFLGGTLLALGLLTRPAAFFIFFTMSVAAFIKHAPDPFQVKELALAYWSISGAYIFLGAGAFSFDHVIRSARINAIKAKDIR